MTVTIKHASVTGAAANPKALVDGPKWDADHVVSVAPPVVRPSDETAYTIKSADFGKILVATNNTAAMTWTLPQNTGAFAAGGTLTVTNDGTMPLFINVTASTINKFKTLPISPDETATVFADGNGNYRAIITPIGLSNGYEKTSLYTSYSLGVLGHFIGATGTPTIGETIGFDYASNAFSTQQFRHTFIAGETFEHAMKDLVSQVKASAALRAAIGSDLIDFTVAFPAWTPTDHVPWSIEILSSYPFCSTGAPNVTAVSSAHATVTVPTGAAGSASLDIGSWIGYGRGTLWAGRQPLAGDRIAGIFITGETTDNPINNHDYQPIYASIKWTILDPTPNIAKGSLLARAGVIQLDTHGAWGSGDMQIRTGLAKINANADGVAAPTIPGAVLHVQGVDGVAASISVDSFGAAPTFLARSAGGTAAAPTALTSGATIAATVFQGFNGSTYKSSAVIAPVTSQAWDTSKSGTQINFYTTPNGTNTLTNSMTLQNSGGLSIGTATDPGVGGGAFSSSVSMASALINGNTAAPVAASVNSYLRVVGGDGLLVGQTIDGYGGTSGGVIYDARVAGGTQAVMTAVTSGTVLYSQRALAWDGASYGTVANIRYVAVGDQTGANHGGSLVFRTTPSGTTTIADAVTVQSSGGFSVGTATDPGLGNLNVKNAVQFGSFTVATLPTGVAGQQVYCSNCRMFNGAGVQEGAAAGTGGMVSYNGTAWKIVGTNVTAVA